VTTASETETPQEPETATTSVDNDAEFTTVTSKHAHRSKANNNSRTSSPSVRSNAAQSKEGDASTTNGTPDASAEKQDTKAEKSENGTENTKEKSDKSEKAEKAEKEKAAPPKELKAAPLPSVNIWQQRKEAQEAKAKTIPAPATGKGKSEESQQDSSKAGSKKKGTDGASEGTKGKKSDGKGRDEALPPVADASSWPTPQVALGEEKKKAQEKTDKPERTDKSPNARSHGKEKWMPVNYVPTAVFNTPLPTPSGRGGRRAARGGRDGGRGGAHGTGATGEKAATGQAAQGSAAKQAAGERGRNETGNSRAASLPAQSRRSTSADVANQDTRKGQAAERGRGGRGAEDAATNGKQVNGGEHFPRPQRDGKQFPRNQDARTGDRNSKNAHIAVDSQAAARANERRAESGSKSADVSRDATGFQEFNRERGDARAERGGRNANRGRGSYSNFGQNPQFGMANNFVPGKFGFNDRQRSQHGVQNGQQQNNRMPLRSPSLPAAGGMYNNVYPFPAEINTMYPSYTNVAPGPMSAAPYQQYMEPFGLMTMLSMQLEYYFSVDNMCKDMFLRRHMDSQGFVPLAVIASFKRVKSLTEDFEMLRHVSRGLRNVDYHIGEDGVDRLRPKERWAQWVLPVDQRDASAQHEGASVAQHSLKNDENAPINSHAEGAPNGSIHNGPRQFVPNGTTSRGSPTPLSSTAPEFQPAQNEIANVGPPPKHSTSPTACSQLEGSFIPPLDSPIIDNQPSACGLSSPPTKSSPARSETEWPLTRYVEYTNSSATRSVNRLTPIVCSLYSFDADQKQGSPTSSVIGPTKKPAKRKNRPSNPKGAGSSDPKSFTSTYHLSENSHLYNPTRQSSATNPGAESGPPYRTWSQHLLRNFNLQLYNEFRQLALDDFFTRHNDYGITALMGFFQASLLSPTPIPEQVLGDIVNLSDDRKTNLSTRVFELLCSSMASGVMEDTNHHTVGFYYNEVYGRRQRAWRKYLA
jgi:la-related protein 1